MPQSASRRQRRIGWLVLGLCVTGGIGYLIGGQKGAITVIAAIGLGVGTLTLLYRALTALLHSTVHVPRTVVGIGVGLLFSFIVGVYYGMAGLSDVERGVLAAGGTILVGLIAGYRSTNHAATSLLHGLVIGGGTGVLFVFIAAQKSFSMQPALDVIVLISGVVAPLVFGMIGGVSGGAGRLLRRTKDAV